MSSIIHSLLTITHFYLQMNYTRRQWGREFKCSGNAREDGVTITVTALFFLLPAVFYIASYSHYHRIERQIVKRKYTLPLPFPLPIVPYPCKMKKNLSYTSNPLMPEFLWSPSQQQAQCNVTTSSHKLNKKFTSQSVIL